MENENSSSDTLKAFAKKSGRYIEFIKSPYEKSYVHWSSRVWHQRKLYIPNNPKGTSFFVSFADARSVNLNSEDVLYSGVFIPILLPSAARITMRKKDILDKLNVFNKKKFLKSGFSHFDARVTIRGNDSLSAQKLLKSRKVQDAIFEAFNKEESLAAGINTVNADFVPQLKNHSLFGIYSLSGWILEEELIEFLFHRMEEIRERLQG